MSNVLIGIIGVILFIGLALAGALFLGPRFQDATVNSKASANVQAVQQVANAAQMYQVDTGTRIRGEHDNSGVAWLSPGYLKSVPKPDPTAVGPNTYAYYNGTVAYMQFGSDDASRRLCEAVQKQVGQKDAPGRPLSGMIDMADSLTVWPVGCVLHSTGLYTVYATI